MDWVKTQVQRTWRARPFTNSDQCSPEAAAGSHGAPRVCDDIHLRAREPGGVACPHDILVSDDWLRLDAPAISYGNLACKSTRKSDDISVKVKARIDTLRQDQPESVE